IILATIILSALIASFPAAVSLLNKKTFGASFDAFVYSFLGGLLGGFLGTIAGFIAGYIVSLIFPHRNGLYSDNLYTFFAPLFIAGLCWFICVLVGAIKTIKPLIVFFSK
ncbi:MAG: hypothetical protein AAGM46_15390, partial [Cyanobacteria bacterium J06582_2]